MQQKDLQFKGWIWECKEVLMVEMAWGNGAGLATAQKMTEVPDIESGSNVLRTAKKRNNVSIFYIYSVFRSLWTFSIKEVKCSSSYSHKICGVFFQVSKPSDLWSFDWCELLSFSSVKWTLEGFRLQLRLLLPLIAV